MYQSIKVTTLPDGKNELEHETRLIRELWSPNSLQMQTIQ